MAAHLEGKKKRRGKGEFRFFFTRAASHTIPLILSQPPPCCRAVLNRRFVRKSSVSGTKAFLAISLAHFRCPTLKIAEF